MWIDLLTLLALAVALAMDAGAVSVTRGLMTQRVRMRNAVKVGIFFGGFQALMPGLGWIVGRGFGKWIEAWDHWIAFGLLSALGIRMLQQARSELEQTKSSSALIESDSAAFDTRTLFWLAIATSIDAFAAGITLPTLGLPIVTSLIVIGGVTFILSVVGVLFGSHFGSYAGRRFDIVGGVILILLGVKILFEHLTAN